MASETLPGLVCNIVGHKYGSWPKMICPRCDKEDTKTKKAIQHMVNKSLKIMRDILDDTFKNQFYLGS